MIPDKWTSSEQGERSKKQAKKHRKGGQVHPFWVDAELEEGIPSTVLQVSGRAYQALRPTPWPLGLRSRWRLPSALQRHIGNITARRWHNSILYTRGHLRIQGLRSTFPKITWLHRIACKSSSFCLLDTLWAPKQKEKAVMPKLRMAS